MQYTAPSGSGPALTVRHTGQEFPLTQAPVTIGRQPDCTVILADPQVSRQHAAISYQAGRYIVQDLGSANGTYINERRITAPQALRDGDQLRLGNTVFDVRLAAGGVAPTVYGQPMAPYADAPEEAAGRQISATMIVGLLLTAIVAVGLIIAVLLLLLSRRGGELAVTILSPSDGAQIATGGQLVLQASATGTKDITRLEMSVDGQVVASTASQDPDGSPSLTVSHSFTFDQPGPHTISATAYTAGGSAGETASVGVTVGQAVGQTTPTATLQTTPTPSAEAPTPTDTPSPQPTDAPPTDAPTATHTPTATSTPTATNTPTATPTPTPSVTATPTPVIEFWADATAIPAGGSTTLRWHVEHVSAIYLDGVPVTGPEGSQLVAPVATTIYRLRVVYPGGEVTKEVTITVTPGGGSWTHPIRFRNKRTFFHMRLTGPGQIRAYAEWTGSQSELTLIIAGTTDAVPKEQVTGPSGTEVDYTVTAADFANSDSWWVTISNGGDGDASGIIYLTYPSGSSAAAPALSFNVGPNNRRSVSLIVLHGAGALSAQATWSGLPEVMSLALYGPGRSGFYFREDGGSPLSGSYTVTASDLGAGDLWWVTSSSSADTEGSITITYP